MPTTLEAGYPNSDYIFWIGVFAPGGTPPAIVQRLYDEITKAKADPAIKQAAEKLGAEPMMMTPSQYDAFIRAEIATIADVVKAAGIKPN